MAEEEAAVAAAAAEEAAVAAVAAAGMVVRVMAVALAEAVARAMVAPRRPQRHVSRRAEVGPMAATARDRYASGATEGEVWTQWA